MKIGLIKDRVRSLHMTDDPAGAVGICGFVVAGVK